MPRLRVTADDAEIDQEQGILSDLSPENANNLQFEWIKHKENFGDESNFYIIDEKGQMWMVTPDAGGANLIATPVIQQYVFGEESAIYPGNDAWNDLYNDIGPRFSLVPPPTAEPPPATRYAHRIPSKNSRVWFSLVQDLLKAFESR